MESVKFKVVIESQQFDFERLSVYQKALRFVNAIFTLSDGFGNRVQYSLGDQLRRAALSIVNNIAEGSDKRSQKEKAKYYSIALDSARECIPMLSICKDQALIDKQAHDFLRADCFEVCRMLRGLLRSAASK